MKLQNPKLLYCPKLDLFASLEYDELPFGGWSIQVRCYRKEDDVEFTSKELPHIYADDKDKILALRKLYLEDLYSCGFQVPKTLIL